jgi:hypothetical protein
MQLLGLYRLFYCNLCILAIKFDCASTPFTVETNHMSGKNESDVYLYTNNSPELCQSGSVLRCSQASASDRPASDNRGPTRSRTLR